MKHREVLSKLKALDLSNVPSDLIRDHIREFGEFGVMLYILEPGTRITRARRNYKGERFENVSDLSYKPSHLNHEFQRASSPGTSMFYASYQPTKIKEGEAPTSLVTVALEASEAVRDKNSVCEETFTFSSWEVTKPIELVSIVGNADFSSRSKLMGEMHESFISTTVEEDQLSISSREISDFLSDQFAKFPINNHTDYMISAIFSELFTSPKDGIMYPSVRLLGHGINVAIKPSVVHTSLRFIGAYEQLICKNKDHVIFAPQKRIVETSNGRLAYLDLPEHEYLSIESARVRVGLL